MENITVTARRTDPNVANSIDFLTGVPIGFFDNQQGLPSSLTQGGGYQTGVSDDIQRQINEGLALQQAQHEEKMAEELAEELAENLESEIADSAESALSDASQNMSLIDRIVQGAMAKFGPTAGVRALNELFSILPGTGRITGGIEGLLDLGDEWVGDLASRNLFSRAIDRLAPAERAGRGAIESAENRYSKIVDPIKMGMEWMRIMQNPLAGVAGMAFEGKPNAQRLVRSALTPPPPGMAQGGAVNYNDPLMMRRGGMTRRRRGRRGGIDSLMARRRRLSPAEALRQQRLMRRMPERRNPRQMPGSEQDRRMIEELRRMRGRRPEMPPSGPVPRGERPFPTGGWHGGRVPGETLPGEPTELPLPQLPRQRPPMPDALQQMLDLMGANEQILKARRNPIRNIGLPGRAASFRRVGAIDPFARYRARRR